MLVLIISSRVYFFVFHNTCYVKKLNLGIKMKELRGEIIQPEFNEYKYYHEVGIKP